MQARTKLRIACGLLALSMVPLLVDFAYWRGPEPAHPAVWIIAAVTALIAWWTSRGGRAGWVVGLIRALLQSLFMGLLVTNTLSHSSRMTEQLAQGMASLGCALASFVALLFPSVRRYVREPKQPVSGDARPPRPLSRWATPRVLGGLVASSLLLGAIEQQVLYWHLSVGEWLLRALYLALPWLGAWGLAKLGRDRGVLTVLGALIGEVLSEQGSALVSNAQIESFVLNLIFPLTSVPALLLGLALALVASRRPPWLLIPTLALAQLLYRQASAGVHAAMVGEHLDGAWLLRSVLPWQAILLSLGYGALCATAIWRLRSTVDSIPEPPKKQGSVEQPASGAKLDAVAASNPLPTPDALPSPAPAPSPEPAASPPPASDPSRTES